MPSAIPSTQSCHFSALARVMAGASADKPRTPEAKVDPLQARLAQQRRWIGQVGSYTGLISQSFKLVSDILQIDAPCLMPQVHAGLRRAKPSTLFWKRSAATRARSQISLHPRWSIGVWRPAQRTCTGEAWRARPKRKSFSSCLRPVRGWPCQVHALTGLQVWR